MFRCREFVSLRGSLSYRSLDGVVCRRTRDLYPLSGAYSRESVRKVSQGSGARSADIGQRHTNRFVGRRAASTKCHLSPGFRVHPRPEQGTLEACLERQMDPAVERIGVLPNPVIQA